MTVTASTTMLVLSTLEDGFSPAAVLTLGLAAVALVTGAWWFLVRMGNEG